MISQIPNIIYAMSLARTKRYKTPLGDVSIHHVDPHFFGFFERYNDAINIAIPEKALIDIFYLHQTKTKLFNRLPELEKPAQFNPAVAMKIINTIRSPSRRSLVKRLYEQVKWQ